MKNVTVTTTVRVALTRDQWQLFDNTEPYIVIQLNRQIEAELNQASDYQDAFRRCDLVLARYREYGASDTEPRGVVTDLVRLRFPEAF